MKREITWKAPTGDKVHEIPEAATVTFKIDDRELVVNIMETGKNKYRFVQIDTGMKDVNMEEAIQIICDFVGKPKDK